MLSSSAHVTSKSGLPSPPAPSVRSTLNDIAPKAYSCHLCSRRKVKCDKTDPCLNCKRKGVECVFRTPAPPRRRKKTLPEAALLSRLKKAEELLKSHGLTIGAKDDDSHMADSQSDDMDMNTFAEGRDSTSHNEKPTVPAMATSGRLIVDEGKSRYVDRSVAYDIDSIIAVLLTYV